MSLLTIIQYKIYHIDDYILLRFSFKFIHIKQVYKATWSYFY